MLSSNLFVFLYVVTFIAGAVLATFLFIIAAKKGNLFYKRLRNFNIAFLCYVAFEFLLYYFVGVGADQIPLLIVTVLSDLFYYTFAVCWVLVIESSYRDYRVVNSKILIAITVICFVVAELIVLISSGSNDSKSVTEMADTSRDILIAINFLYDIFLLYCGVRFTVHGLRLAFKNKGHWMPIVFSTSFILYMMWVLQWDFTLVSSGTITGEDLTIADPIIAFYIFICMAAIYYMYRKDISVEAQSAQGDEAAIQRIVECYNLTARETEVLALIFLGYGNGRIAQELFISEHTVKRHVNSIFKKTGTKGRYELLTLS